MDEETYRKAYFVEPPPAPRFHFCGQHGAALFFEDYQAAVAYYQKVLGPPGYVEGKGTKGWRIGNTWLTLLQGKSGNPENVEIILVMETTEEAERLQQAFIDAGGSGIPPSDQLMYQKVRACPVTDPFGTMLLIICWL
jgi:hypothetical protein